MIMTRKAGNWWICLLAGLTLMAGVAEGKNMSGIEKSSFGKLSDGTEVDLYALSNKNGLVCKVITYGATIIEMQAPDRKGQMTNVMLSYDDLEGYVKGGSFFGTTAGRVANRIAKGKFTVDGKTYELAINNGKNHLHGGLKGFDKAVWKEAEISPKDGRVKLTHVSPDGDEGYPGTLKASVTYILNDENELHIIFEGTTDKATPVNLCNHSYWNLAGEGNVLEHLLKLGASHYTPVDEGLIPTGEIKSVKGTPFDFTSPEKIGARFDQFPTGKVPGYDHNFVLDSNGEKMVFCARVEEPKSGRVMEVRTEQPGVQLYTGNFLNGAKGKGGASYPRYGGFCLETQNFPDFVNHTNFPDGIVRPGEKYRRETVHKFSVK